VRPSKLCKHAKYMLNTRKYAKWTLEKPGLKLYIIHSISNLKLQITNSRSQYLKFLVYNGSLIQSVRIL
jgi:hypothetical protein